MNADETLECENDQDRIKWLGQEVAALQRRIAELERGMKAIAGMAAGYSRTLVIDEKH